MRIQSFVGLLRVCASLVALFAGAHALADGVWLPKSGPIQATPDGNFVWCVNADHDSITRLATIDNSIMEFALPASSVPNKPRALAVRPGGAEIWVAAYDSDRIFVIEAATGMELATIPLHHGAGPIAIAFSPTGDHALVALYRADSVASIDAPTRAITKTYSNMAPKPLSIAFGTNTIAYVAHQFNDGDNGYFSLIDSASQKLAFVHRVRSVDPKFPFQIPAEDPQIPEGGWVFPTAHIAVRPQTNDLWLPMQLQNFRANPLSTETVIQAALLKLNTLSNDIDLSNRIVFTAYFAHNQTNQLLGDGWNAGVAGPSDVAFSADGAFGLISMAHSNDLLVVPAATGISKPPATAPLVEIPVGSHPIGVTWSPISDRVYVLNSLSRDISVIDPALWVETARIPAVISIDPVDPEILLGAKIFNTSADPRASINQKVSCASCHPGGETDGLLWDFTSLNAGRRKTLTMRGQAISMAPQANGRGQVHRSGDRDEIQDFDLTFSGNFMLGTGFLFPPNAALAAPNAGLNADLDALAAFVLDLPPLMRSPHRNADGSLTDAAVRGAMLFQLTSGPLATGCITCHPAPAYTDFGFHNVGGFRPLPDYEGPAFNTPTLVSSWDSGGFRQIIPVSGSAITRQVGFEMWDVLRSTDSGGLQANLHGSVSQLSHALMRDLEAFLNELDGDLAATDITTLTDTTPPRILALLPVSMNAVDVVFSEAVDPITAADTANYLLTDGINDLVPASAVVDTELGNRVRLSVNLIYSGCTSTYTLVPGPIADMAAALGAPQPNLLDVNDASNLKSFVMDGTITVTFGNTGLDTFPSVAADAAFDARAGQSNTSYDRIILSPATTPETKGFLRFDFSSLLSSQSNVTDPASIIDAHFSLLPDVGGPTSIELRRVFKPWGDPDKDNCISCAGALTFNYSRFNTIPWSLSGARILGGAGTSPAEYHPTQSFVDAALATDATVAMTDVESRISFSGPTILDAFRFWHANPTLNNGYIVETVGTTGPLVEFWSAEADGGSRGPILSLTFTVPVSPLQPDCNNNGRLDSCDIALGSSFDVDLSGIPDECELPPCPADWNANAVTDVPDIFAFLTDWFSQNAAADFDGNEEVAVPDIFAFLSAWFAGCPT